MNHYVNPHPESAVLLIIDTQNDFTVPGAPAEIEGTAEAVPQMTGWSRRFVPRTLRSSTSFGYTRRMAQTSISVEEQISKRERRSSALEPTVPNWYPG
jgi:hypothetical protein